MYHQDQEEAKKLKLGNGLDEGVVVGPMFEKKALAGTQALIDDATGKGAKLLTGGKRSERFERGYFFEPTVLSGLSADAKVLTEEPFAPVMPVLDFGKIDDVIAAANNTQYGLAAYVWTSDLRRAHNFAQAIDSGMVWLNSNNVRDLRTPFGGVKASGLGREGGYRSIDFYTTQQSVQITLGTAHTPSFGKQLPPVEQDLDDPDPR